MMKQLWLLAPLKTKLIICLVCISPAVCISSLYMIDGRDEDILKHVKISGQGELVKVDAPVNEKFKQTYGEYRRMSDGKGRIMYGFNDFVVLTNRKKDIISYTLMDSEYPINGGIRVGSSFEEAKRVYGEPDSEENMWDEKTFVYYNKKEKRYLRFFVKEQIIQKIEYGKMVPLPSHQELVDN